MSLYRNTAIALTTLFLFAACGGDGGEPLSHKLEELDHGIAELDSTVLAHESAVAAATTLGDISAEESVYATNGGAAHEELHHMLGDMSMCMHDGTALDVTGLEETVEEIEAELAAHASAMAAAADMAAAESEETRHQAAIETMILSLQSGHDTMEADAHDYMCEDHHGDTGH